jgi:branched-chain amino acid transport system ATP-binding protein
MTPTLLASRSALPPEGAETSLGRPGGGLPANELLRIENLNAWYGESHVLHGVNMSVNEGEVVHGVNMSVNEGEVVSLLGRNGAGRTTTMRAIVGLTGARSGSIRIRGTEAIKLPPHRIARLGVGYCPEERGIFASLSAEENLLLPPAIADGGMSIADIYAMFPNLKERAASPGMRLSGGEQQMLAVARILRTGARLLLLDEISEGLAPVIVQKLAETIRTLKAKGYTIVLVEQNFRFAAPLADRFYVMEHGRMVREFRQGELAENTAMLNEYLGV